MALSYASMFLKKDGTIYGCGSNSSGQLGLGSSTASYEVPVNIPIEDVKMISCGEYHTAFLKNDGTVYTCGYGYYGQLGTGSTSNKTSPVKITSLTDVKTVSCGGSHTVFVKNDGTAYSCGYGWWYQLGLTHGSNVSTPSKVGLEDIKSVSCGDDHTVFLKNDETVYGCGGNFRGCLGIGSNVERQSLAKIPLENVKMVSCGEDLSVFLKNDGTVYASGYNAYGQLGIGSTTNKNTPVKVDIEDVEYISCGRSHVIFLKKDGTVYGCGLNSSGQLGIGNTTNQTSPVKIPIEDVKAISCGNSHTTFLKSDGTIYGCGYNTSGQLGIANTENQTSIFQALVEDVKHLFEPVNPTILYILKDNNVYKTLVDGVLEDLGEELPSIDVIKNKGITYIKRLLLENEGIRPIDSLSNKFDILTYAENAELDKFKYRILPKPHIMKATGDISLTAFEKIKKVEVITTGSGGIVKVAISFDKGNTWKTYTNGEWTEISIDSATFKEQGIDVSQLASMINTYWDIALVDRTIRFAYYIEYESTTDSIALNSLRITGDIIGRWKRAKLDTDYNYGYISNDVLVVDLLTDGAYKINYNEPN